MKDRTGDASTASTLLRELSRQSPQVLGFSYSTDYESLIQEVNETAEIAGRAADLPLHALPLRSLYVIRDRATSCSQLMLKAKVVFGERTTESQKKDLLEQISRFPTHAAELRAELFNAFGYLAVVETEFPVVRTKIQSLVAAIENERGQLETDRLNRREHYSEMVKEVRDLQAQLRTMFGESGVKNFKELFEKRAWAERIASWIWLVTSALLAASTVRLAFLFAEVPLPADATFQNVRVIELLVSRVVALGLAASAAVWSARMYRARAHLSARYLLRATALETVDLFSKSAHSPGVRDAIMAEASRLIFADASTGLADEQLAPPDSPITRVIQSMPLPWGKA